MKKITFLAAAAAAVAMSANAQYTCNPETSAVLEKGKVNTVWSIVLDPTSINQFEQQGASVIAVGANGENRNFWWWNGWSAGDDSFPGVGMHFDGYVSLNVTGDGGWSGGGFACAAPGIDIAGFNANTRFHIAYRTATTAPASVAFIICDAGAPAKVAVGDPFVDNGAVFPAVGPVATADWQGVDISFSDLKKIFPAFDWTKCEANATTSSWTGNILSILSGATPNTNICIDAAYFYNAGESGVNGVEAEKAAFTVTKNTVNSTVAGIEVYSMDGAKVKATAGTTLGIDDLAKGVYVAKSGKDVVKFVK